MRLTVSAIAAIGGLCLSGCTLVGSEAWYVKNQRPTLLKRAACDLNCLLCRDGKFCLVGNIGFSSNLCMVSKQRKPFGNGKQCGEYGICNVG